MVNLLNPCKKCIVRPICSKQCDKKTDINAGLFLIGNVVCIILIITSWL